MFREDVFEEDCRGCIKEFTKQVIAYLSLFNFLVFEHQREKVSNDQGQLSSQDDLILMGDDGYKVNARIVPTQLGKAAFSSCIPPEFSLQILKDLWHAR